MLIIGPKYPTCNNLEHYLTLDGCSVNSSSSSVRNLGVLFDSNLSFESHVSSICKTAFFHLKNISKLRPMLSTSNAEILIHAFMTSRLDYCNALLGGCSAHLINKLQLVQNAARVLTRTRKVPLPALLCSVDVKGWLRSICVFIYSFTYFYFLFFLHFTTDYTLYDCVCDK